MKLLVNSYILFQSLFEVIIRLSSLIQYFMRRGHYEISLTMRTTKLNGKTYDIYI